MPLILARQRGGQGPLPAAGGRAARRCSPTGCPSVRPAATRRRCGAAPAPTATTGCCRAEVLDHQRRDLAVLHGAGGHRPRGPARRRHLGVRGRALRRRVHLRRAGEEDRHQGRRRPASCIFDGVPDPGRPHGRRAGRGPQDRPAHARPHPRHHRRAGRRHRPGRAGLRRRLRQGALAVRQAHRRVPGHPVHARRHGDEARGGPADGLRGRGQVRARRRRPALLRCGRQVLRLRRGDGGHHRRGPAARRGRLRQGLPGRADDARRQDHPDLRGHQPDPATRDGTQLLK